MTTTSKNGQWASTPRAEGWSSGEPALTVAAQIMGETALADPAIPLDWAKECVGRLHRLRDELRKAWVGLVDETGEPLLDWLLAACAARENVLLLGPPGGAKSQIALRTLDLLGLKSPQPDPQVFTQTPENVAEAYEAWQTRAARARREQKYFHYLLSRFTQPEELFGPVDISLLRQGVLARVNFGLLTGPGVWAAFLDEVFKSSSSIANTLLTLSQERRYFNWGGMQPADLAVLIGASNEMPGGFASGTVGIGAAGEDFQTLHAFVDRFPLRLPIPIVSGESADDAKDSDLSQAFQLAMSREAEQFVHGHHFGPVSRPQGMPGINDLLAVGRAAYQHEPAHPLKKQAGAAVGGKNACCLFREPDLRRFREAFIRMGAALQIDGTNTSAGHLMWTISPRKLKALYKIALAHALIVDDKFVQQPAAEVVSDLGERQLHVFDFIWDSPTAKGRLNDQTKALIDRYL